VIALRVLAATALWGCVMALPMPRCDVAVLRGTLEGALIAALGPDTWLAAADWGTSCRVLDPAYSARQKRRNDCGPACLLRVLETTQGANRPRALPQPGVSGCTLGALHRAAARSGLRGDVRQVTDLGELLPPAILHLRRHHFVVLEALQPGLARVFDPGHGLLLLRRSTLQRSFSGAAMQFALRPPARRRGGS